MLLQFFLVLLLIPFLTHADTSRVEKNLSILHMLGSDEKSFDQLAKKISVTPEVLNDLNFFLKENKLSKLKPMDYKIAGTQLKSKNGRIVVDFKNIEKNFISFNSKEIQILPSDSTGTIYRKIIDGKSNTFSMFLNMISTVAFASSDNDEYAQIAMYVKSVEASLKVCKDQNKPNNNIPQSMEIMRLAFCKEDMGLAGLSALSLKEEDPVTLKCKECKESSSCIPDYVMLGDNKIRFSRDGNESSYLATLSNPVDDIINREICRAIDPIAERNPFRRPFVSLHEDVTEQYCKILFNGAYRCCENAGRCLPELAEMNERLKKINTSSGNAPKESNSGSTGR